MTVHLSLVLGACFLAAVGCAAEMKSGSAPEAAMEETSLPPSTAEKTSAVAGTTDQKLPVTQSAAEKGAAKRKIIYRAEVDLVVEQFDPLPDQIEAAVKQHGGFVSASNLTGSPGRPRSGRWTVRVPVDRFSDFLAAVRGLGEVRSINCTSDDVTAEYYDIESRIRNKQQEEERLLKLLAEATGKLEEVLAVERELSRVRGEIEQAQGRLRMLKDVTELTTVTVSATEIKNYVPEQAPTYATRVQRVFAASTATLVSTGQALFLMAVAITPWLPVPLLLILFVVAIRWRRQRRRGQ